MALNIVTGVVGVVLFATLTAIASGIRLPLPGTPVPMTLQTVPVLLAGAFLGSWLGTCSQALYILVGVAGLPVFTGGGSGIEYIGGPTSGYLLGFLVAPWIVGQVASLGSPSWWRVGLAMAAGTLAIFIPGCMWLALSTGSMSTALGLGVLPFLPAAAVKWLMTSAVGAGPLLEKPAF